MSKSRRQFLTNTSLALLGAPAGAEIKRQNRRTAAWCAAHVRRWHRLGPEVSPSTFAEAEKLVQVELTSAERGMAARSWRANMASLYERRTGPRKVALEPSLAPSSRWDPVLPGEKAGPDRDQFIRSKTDPGPLPASDEDIAFAPLTKLSRWIEQRKLTSQRLTELYLARMEKFNPKLRCVITLTRELAHAQAKKADEEIAAGKYRGPLHGVPWGAKDLLDTAGIPTTYGAEPFRNRMPAADAAVVKRLARRGRGADRQVEHGCAGAQRYLVRRPDDEPVADRGRIVGIERGSWRCHCGGIGGFRHRERDGRQHRKPFMRCGITGLRPTYGRVPRTGAMTLCWSLDKLGPMTRSVEDAMLVLHAISGPRRRRPIQRAQQV